MRIQANILVLTIFGTSFLMIATKAPYYFMLFWVRWNN